MNAIKVNKVLHNLNDKQNEAENGGVGARLKQEKEAGEVFWILHVDTDMR